MTLTAQGGRAIMLYLDLSRDSRVVWSSPVLCCPVISRTALLYAMIRRLTCYRHPCNFPFPLMLANFKPPVASSIPARSPSYYPSEALTVGRLGRISRPSHHICACVKPLLS